VDKTTLLSAIFTQSLPALGSSVPFRPPQVEQQEWNRVAASTLPWVTQAVVKVACEQVAKVRGMPVWAHEIPCFDPGQAVGLAIGFINE